MAPSPAMAVPASLYASLMARLDRLGPAKEVAQIGAVIGREFSHALLALVVGKPETELSAASTVLSRPVCCFGRECLRTPIICSSTRSYRMQRTEHCCASDDARFTPASLKPLKTILLRLPKISRNYWLATIPKPARLRRQPVYGAKRDSGRGPLGVGRSG